MTVLSCQPRRLESVGLPDWVTEPASGARVAAVLDRQSGVGVAVQVAPELVICAATCMADMADQLPARADGPAAEARM